MRVLSELQMVTLYAFRDNALTLQWKDFGKGVFLMVKTKCLGHDVSSAFKSLRRRKFIKTVRLDFNPDRRGFMLTDKAMRVISL